MKRTVKSLTVCTLILAIFLSCAACSKKSSEEVFDKAKEPSVTAAPGSKPKDNNKTENDSVCDHKKTRYVIITEADCTKQGSYKYVCENCGETTSTGIIESGHTVVIDAAEKATCQNTGLTEGSHCSVCGEIIQTQNVIPKTSHLFSKGYCIYCNTKSPEENEPEEYELPERIG